MNVLARHAFLHLLSCLLVWSSPALANDYYVSTAGDDSNPGTMGAPWQSIARVNTTRLLPGDRVLFAGKETFFGMIDLDAADAGDPANPVTFSSYGNGRAVIHGGAGRAFQAYNCAGFEVRNLDFRGSGMATNTDSGVAIWMDINGGVKLEHIYFDSVDIGNFGLTGMWIGSNGADFSGFRDIRITNSEFHHNQQDGFFTWGQYTVRPGAPYSHENIYVGGCKFHDNPGLVNANTGNGMYLKDVSDALVEHCEAYNNGAVGGIVGGGGPYGIWALQSNDVTIQFCESHHNATGGGNDGGGFDLDGGTTNSTVQYCYSHDNQGPGMLVLDGRWARPGFDNTIRFNISENDGRGTGETAGVLVTGATRANIYNNTIVRGAGSGSPAVKVGAGAKTIAFYNNILVTTDGRELVHNQSASVTFLGNDYHARGGAFRIRWGAVTYPSLASWRNGTGQERLGNLDLGFDVDPLLASAGAGGTVGEPDVLENLSAYKLLPGSTMVGSGLDLETLFGVDPGPADYYQNTLPQGGGFDVGAHERPASTNQPPLLLATPRWGRIGANAVYEVRLDDPDGVMDLAKLTIDVKLDRAWVNLWPRAAAEFTAYVDAAGRYHVQWRGLGILTPIYGPWRFRARLWDMAGEMDQKMVECWD